MTGPTRQALAEQLAEALQCTPSGWFVPMESYEETVARLARVLAAHETAYSQQHQNLLDELDLQRMRADRNALAAHQWAKAERLREAAEAQCRALTEQLSDAHEEARQWRVLREFSEKEKTVVEAERDQLRTVVKKAQAVWELSTEIDIYGRIDPFLRALADLQVALASPRVPASEEKL